MAKLNIRESKSNRKNINENPEVNQQRTSPTTGGAASLNSDLDDTSYAKARQSGRPMGENTPTNANPSAPNMDKPHGESVHKMHDERMAAPVTSFKGTGFGAWADGAVSLLMPSYDSTYSQLMIEKGDFMDIDPSENPKIAITKTPEGVGTASRLDNRTYQELYGPNSRKGVFRKDRKTAKELNELAKGEDGGLFGTYPSAMMQGYIRKTEPDALQPDKHGNAPISNERVVSQNAWTLIRNPSFAKNLLVTQLYDALAAEHTIPGELLNEIKQSIDAKDHVKTMELGKRALSVLGEKSADSKAERIVTAVFGMIKEIDESAESFKQPYQTKLEDAIATEADEIFRDLQRTFDGSTEKLPGDRPLIDFDEMAVEDKQRIISYLTQNPQPYKTDPEYLKAAEAEVPPVDPLPETDEAGIPIQYTEPERALYAQKVLEREQAVVQQAQAAYEADREGYLLGMRNILAPHVRQIDGSDQRMRDKNVNDAVNILAGHESGGQEPPAGTISNRAKALSHITKAMADAIAPAASLASNERFADYMTMRFIQRSLRRDLEKFKKSNPDGVSAEAYKQYLDEAVERAFKYHDKIPAVNPADKVLFERRLKEELHNAFDSERSRHVAAGMEKGELYVGNAQLLGEAAESAFQEVVNGNMRKDLLAKAKTMLPDFTEEEMSYVLDNHIQRIEARYKKEGKEGFVDTAMNRERIAAGVMGDIMRVRTQKEPLSKIVGLNPDGEMPRSNVLSGQFLSDYIHGVLYGKGQRRDWKAASSRRTNDAITASPLEEAAVNMEKEFDKRREGLAEIQNVANLVYKMQKDEISSDAAQRVIMETTRVNVRHPGTTDLLSEEPADATKGMVKEVNKEMLRGIEGEAKMKILNDLAGTNAKSAFNHFIMGAKASTELRRCASDARIQNTSMDTPSSQATKCINQYVKELEQDAEKTEQLIQKGGNFIGLTPFPFIAILMTEIKHQNAHEEKRRIMREFEKITRRTAVVDSAENAVDKQARAIDLVLDSKGMDHTVVHEKHMADYEYSLKKEGMLTSILKTGAGASPESGVLSKENIDTGIGSIRQMTMANKKAIEGIERDFENAMRKSGIPLEKEREPATALTILKAVRQDESLTEKDLEKVRRQYGSVRNYFIMDRLRGTVASQLAKREASLSKLREEFDKEVQKLGDSGKTPAVREKEFEKLSAEFEKREGKMLAEIFALRNSSESLEERQKIIESADHAQVALETMFADPAERRDAQRLQSALGQLHHIAQSRPGGLKELLEVRKDGNGNTIANETQQAFYKAAGMEDIADKRAYIEAVFSKIPTPPKQRIDAADIDAFGSEENYKKAVLAVRDLQYRMHEVKRAGQKAATPEAKKELEAKYAALGARHDALMNNIKTLQSNPASMLVKETMKVVKHSHLTDLLRKLLPQEGRDGKPFERPEAVEKNLRRTGQTQMLLSNIVAWGRRASQNRFEAQLNAMDSIFELMKPENKDELLAQSTVETRTAAKGANGLNVLEVSKGANAAIARMVEQNPAMRAAGVLMDMVAKKSGIGHSGADMDKLVSHLGDLTKLSKDPTAFIQKFLQDRIETRARNASASYGQEYNPDARAMAI